MPRIFNNILLFVGLVIAQAVIFNNLVLFNSAVALVFIYFIIRLPVTMSINWLLTVGFFTGLSVDIFQDTLGLNALACTLLAALKKPVFYLYVPSDEDLAGKRIGIATVGSGTYLKYLLTMVVIYCVLVFTIESINYNNYKRILIRIGASALLTFIILYAFESLTLTRNEKKL